MDAGMEASPAEPSASAQRRYLSHCLSRSSPQTNGLDIETIDALAEAINEFKGGVVLVSHDMRLISQVAKDIYECDHRKVVRFPGDIAEYKALLEAKISAASAAFGDSFKKVAAAMGKK